ncbi:hypothetical protein [Catalinimonas niigatensis]|uniref:hypothetical protein n=1 Tax=Catalinimonas niigatensis TaxID=1397264 RepID=UPI002666E7FD|nr:hypothetical protein [Catalinimonas niigatensis]WPP49977.1 hypothetical protein PZB72_25265 [Catalinimonas niigatensis]
MAKRKKGKSKAFSPKLQEAQHRKAYIRKLIYFAEAVGVEDFDLIASVDTLHYLFNMRVGVSTLITNSPEISVAILKDIREVHEKFLNEFRFTFTGTADGKVVTLRDFLSIGHALYYFLTSDKPSFSSEILKQRFAEYIELMENDPFPFTHLYETLWQASLAKSTLDTKMYWVNHEYKLKDLRLTNHFELHAVRPEQKIVKINGIFRKVLRVGWARPIEGPEWISIDASHFGLAQSLGKASLPLFIQPHALHRMDERLDCIDAYLQHFYLYLSLLEPKVVENQMGLKLIEYIYQDKKLGYLLADVVDGIVVVRTFLFITMDRTPEGQALQQTIGLEAVDKKYLAIDRLSTFILSDIPNHPDIKEHFMEAGCTDLFKFDTSALQPEHQIELGQFIRTYLDKDRTQLPQINEFTEEEQLQVTVA